jgi:Na+/H+-dicarboxylate symporter
MKKMLSKIENQVILSLILSVIVGIYFPQIGISSKWLGTLFLNTLKMIIPYLLFASIFTAVLGIGDPKYMGVLGGRTLLLYFLTTCLAVTSAIIIMNIFHPGVGFEITVRDFNPGKVEELSIVSFLSNMIPENILKAFYEGNAMQLVVLAFIFGIAALKIVPEARHEIYVIADQTSRILLEFTKIIIIFTPIGVFGLVSNLIAVNGISAIIDLWRFCAVVFIGFIFHVVVVLFSISAILGKFNLFKYLKTVTPPLLLGFSTASSSATLPLTISTAIERGGIDKKVAEFTLPLGSTVNMDGTCLYQGMVALFIAQALGIDLSISQQITIAFSVVLASVGAAGIPGAGIIMLTVVFSSIGLPMDAIAVIMAVDRILDMFRTALNIAGDLIVAKIVNHHYLTKIAGDSIIEPD